MTPIEEILELFARHGDSEYGGEAVTQLEHGLQAATLAEQEDAAPDLIVAALLHDIGHLLHDLPVDAPEQGIDDHHETAGMNYLKNKFPASVTEPIRMHVAAKRYLCAAEPGYSQTLSEPSVVSLNLQGGQMSLKEMQEFEQSPYWKEAVSLRRWDDAAKDPDLKTPPLEHFAKYMTLVVRGAGDP
ncbi:MAG: HD domain-containing protein [Planctomycetaceae bacterium]|nr:HD domain-containing protein [Planctomycetaceae bacterium]